MSRSRSRAVSHLGIIKRILEELTGYATLAFELIQNADDTKRARHLRFDIRDDALWVEDDGGFSDCGDQDLDPDECPFLDTKGHRCDFHSFRLVSGADKRSREDTTGAMGIGFTAVYQITDRPEIISGSRHWRVDETAPQQDRIQEDEVLPAHAGTRIVLPWAWDKDSPFRRKADVAPAPPDVRDQFRQVLDESLAPAMLFLRHLNVIEIALNGDVVREVRREPEGDDLIIDDGGERQRWRLLRGKFTEEAERLRTEHEDRIETGRKPVVAIAIPHNFDVAGRLCAGLPTETPTQLPLHLNAEFYLKSDRRRLSMDTAHHSAWNRAALQCAAERIVESLGELPSLLGAHRLWQGFQTAWQTAQAETQDPVVSAMTILWAQLQPAIPEHSVVWTSDEHWVTVGDARLIETQDEEALPVLEALGLAIVHPKLRPFRNTLLVANVDLLSVGDLAEALRSHGLDDGVPIDHLPTPLDVPEARSMLWAELGRLIERLRGDEQRTRAREQLTTAAVVPSTTGELTPIDWVWYAETNTVELFQSVVPTVPFLDKPALPVDAHSLADFCDPLTADGAVRELEDRDLALSCDAAAALVGWFAHREDQLDADTREHLAALAAFPSTEAAHPLRELALPGDFEDPLQLTLFVRSDVAREHGPFLERLGAQKLSFPIYAEEHVPRAFEHGDLSLQQRRELVLRLAQRRGELEDEASARRALAELRIVECVDGSWVKPDDAYLENPEVKSVLGRKLAFVSLPTDHHLAVEDLLTWLGVANRPRAEDVIARVSELASRPATSARHKHIENVVRWLGQRWPILDDQEKVQYTSLQSMAWLPQRGSDALSKPGALRLVYRDYLYESQGAFLALAASVQRAAAGFLQWLGMTDEPEVIEVVRHLEYCSDNDVKPNPEVYVFLNANADSPDVDLLRDVACLRVDDGRWLKPSDAFWSEHPFGRWRVRLGDEFLRYRNLLDALGVQPTPTWTEAIAVIRDISAEYGDANLAVPDDDRVVLLECWRLCDANLDDADALAALRALDREKVVADDREVLAQPSRLYFEDLPGLANELAAIKDNIIRRPDGAWRAMHAAGVRNLSKAAIANVVDLGDRLPVEPLEARLLEREEELARVIAPASLLSWRDFASNMRALRWVAVNSLTISWELRAFGRRFASEPHRADALWHSQEEALYVTVSEAAVWEAVARELVRALLPDIEPSALALGIAAALSPQDRATAQRLLNAAGYAELAPELRAEISPSTATQFDTAQRSGDVGEGNEEDDEEPNADDHRSDKQPVTGASSEDEDFEEGDEEVEGHESETDSEGVPVGTAGNGSHPGEGRPGVNGQGTGSGRKRSYGSTRPERRDRLRSYVAAGGETEMDDSPEEDGRSEIDEAGIAAVESYERAAGRVPHTQPHNNKGYDILSECEDGEVARYIEVKSTAGPWDGVGVGMSHSQFVFAQQVEDQSWLYVVEYALSPEQRSVWPIPDPARKVTDFMFDYKWKDLAETENGWTAADGSRATGAGRDEETA